MSIEKQALDQVALGMEVPAEGMRAGAGWTIGNDGDGALVGDGVLALIAVLGDVGHDDVGRKVLDQGVSPRTIASLAGGQGEARRTRSA